MANTEPVPDQKPVIAGRAGELMVLRNALSGAREGLGQTLILLGEAGIGKSRLVDAFVEAARGEGVRVLSGRSNEGDVRPFGLFADAMETLVGGELFGEEASVGFVSVFLVDDSGHLIAKSAARGETMDADTITGMLSAVQNFVRDSFAAGGTAHADLGKLVYGDRTVFVEHGAGIFLAAVAKGGEHQQMRAAIVSSIQRIQASHRPESMQSELDELVAARFRVRKDMDGVRFENERLRIAEHVSNTLSAASEESTVLVLAEDLHWADNSTLFLFTYLARNLGADAVLMIGTARPEGGHGFAKFRESLLDEGTAAELALGGIDLGGVRGMIDSHFNPNELPEDFCQRLATDSKGNPLFIGETLRQMTDDGGIVFEHGAYMLAREDYVLPKSAEEVVRRRLEGLDPEAMAMAEYASCIGVSADSDALSSIETVKDPRAALGRLGLAGILILSDASAAFSHAMFRQVTYQSISPRWKTAYHRRLGRHYEAVCGPDPGDLIYELARHFSACGEQAKAHEYCLKAGERAEGAYAPELARNFYSRALEFLPGTGTQREDAPAILEKLGDSEKCLGHYKEAKADYMKALAMLEAGSRQHLRVLLKLISVLAEMREADAAAELMATAMQWVDAADPDIAGRILARQALLDAASADGGDWQALSEQARGTLGDIPDVPTRVEIYTTLSRAYDARNSPDTAKGLLEIAVTEAEAGGDIRAIAQAYSVIGDYMHYRGQPAAAAKLVEKAVAYLERLGDIGALTAATALLGMTYSDSGELDKSLACLKRALASSRRIGQKPGTATLLGNIGYTLAMMGRHEESLQYQNESLEIRRKTGSKGGMGWSYYDMAQVYDQKGDLEKALECLELAAGLMSEAGDYIGYICVRTSEAGCLAGTGERVKAEAVYREVLELADRKDMALDKFHALMGLATMGAISTEEALPKMREIENRLGAPAVSMALQGFMGRTAAIAGDREGAEACFARGLAIADGKDGSDAELGRAGILLSRAEARLAARDREGAASDAAEAERLFTRWGRLGDARKAILLVDTAPKL